MRAMKIDPLNIRSLLYITDIPGLGGYRIRTLMARFKNPDSILSASFNELVQTEGIDKILARNIVTHTDTGFADRQLELIAKHQVQLITFWDSDYPTNLKKISDPPILLFVKGQLQAGDERAVAVVGTRTPSQYGKVITEKISTELAGRGITIVSGLARGVDTLAHWSAVNSGGRTLAILGSAINKIYPYENQKLAEKIQSQGALISEFSMDTAPDAPNFPRRNRIISGLSKITILVEAGEKSGALITAAMAADQNREVFAVPGNITNPKSWGPNRLIRDGAHIFLSSEEFFAEAEAQLGLKKSSGPSLPPISLSENEKKIYAALSEEPIHIDALAQKCQMSTSRTLAILLTLELKNVVKQLAGKLFVRI